MSAPKRGLGRGLEALIRPPAPHEAVQSLPVAKLRPNRKQPRTRFDEAELETLAASIRVQGIIQPLVVAADGEGGYTIVAGERRWRAAQRAGLERVPVVVREVRDDRELLELALVENLQRSDLDPVEEAEAFRDLHHAFGLSHDEIADRVGKARTTISNSLRLLKLHPAVLELLRAGRLTAGQARPLLGITDPARQRELAERAADQGLNARQLERLAADRPPAPPAPAADVHSVAAAERLTRRLQTRVEIRRRGKGGAMQIHFHSEDELMRLYDRLMGKGEGDAP